ncbi:DEAD/DEAH box helicase [Alkalicoccus luteus]|uniref:DEAD/DEAH box helicase n=1 Tax=Alkalicoccus luteus TaxID=1237094 RepID=A0A969PMY6_9BACI|nr:DEAD/DEAH box helicase [Alkalicoccus luteus]NJP37167.1 DEAD/DEAH box helicase [Alkalicoccus luteus]
MQLRDYQETLIKKIRDSYQRGSRSPCIVLGCGGGKTVLFAFMAEQSQKKGKTVWFAVHRKELLDQTVATFDAFNIDRTNIHIVMIGTVSRNLEKYPKPDFIIFDECHFSAARTWQRIIEAFPDAKIAGLTATPSRLDGKPLGETYDDLILGESVRSLIDRGYLAPYKYYAPSVADLSALKKKRGEFDQSQAEELLSQKAVFGDVIKHYSDIAAGKQTICYCSTIKHSEMMAEEFNAAGIHAVHFDGNTPKRERDRIISRFRKGEITVLCNVDLISVGFDCPDVDCCILLRPTDSTALYIQQACRALRYREGKTAVILDHVNNFERHGLPDDEHEWTLGEKFKKPKNVQEDGMFRIRQCEQCFAVYPTEERVCPNCGHELQVQPKEMENIKEIELEEIKREKEEQKKLIVLDYSSPDDCRNMEELAAYAERQGYKKGWIYHQGKARGFIR